MFTLAICTYNRAALLRDALQSLSHCDPPAGSWELVVVDNNSSDETKAVAMAFSDSLPLRYVFEGEQGLSSARNRALQECAGDIILFTDDDLFFETDWLTGYERVFNSVTHADWYGGRILPHWENRRPAWLRDENMPLISGLLVHYDLGACDRPYESADPTPFGASFALKRSTFERIGPFREDLGVKGNVPGRGEEAEYFERAQTLGLKGFYVGSSSALHRQQAKRFTIPYLYEYGIQKGTAIVRLGGEPIGRFQAAVRQISYSLRGAMQLLKGRGDRFRQCIINAGIASGMRRGN